MSEASLPSQGGTTPRAPVLGRGRPALVIASLIFTDLFGLAVALLVSLWIRTVFVGSLALQPYIKLLPALLLCPVVYAYAGLYPGYGLGPVEELRRLARYTTLIFLFIIAGSFYVKVSHEFSRLLFVGAWVGSVVLLPLLRASMRAVASRTQWWGERVLILGAARTAELLVQKLRSNPRLGLLPVACLDDNPGRHGGLCGGVPVVGPLCLAREFREAHGLSSVIVAMPGLGRQRTLEVVEEHARLFPKVRLIPDLLGITSLWVSACDLQGVLGLRLHQNLLSSWSRLLKRTLDLVVAVPLLLLTSPFILLAGLAVKLNSPGPAFYYQEREGLNGRRIRVWKIRTMVPDAEKVLEQHLVGNPAVRQEWDQYMKLRDDPRIVPRVGQIFRRFSVDELPQLWNILKGEMSLVGPRPFPDYHLGRFTPRFRELRARVTPGLTGLWQVSARSDGDLVIQEELDTYYIRNWSLWLDVYLLARTASAVLFGKGAY